MTANSKNKWESDPEYIGLMNFLIEKTKDANSPLNILGLTKEYMEMSGCSQQLGCMLSRVSTFRSNILQMNSIDTETKVKMIFALSVPIQESFLNELRKDALVEVDCKSRITKYKANNGSLELEGNHNFSVKAKEGWKKRKLDSESQDSIPKTPESVKREAPEVMTNSSKKTKHSSLARLIKSEDQDPDPRIQQLLQPKLEGAPGAHIPQAAFRTPKSEANDAQTPQIKFLEAIHFLIFPLDIPSLSQLQKKIEQKILESPDANIPNNELIPAMELLFAKITNHSVSNLPEKIESVSLSHFLCYLNAAILNSKLAGLEVLLEKIKDCIKEPDSKNKSIPVEKVTSVLQDTLNNVGFKIFSYFFCIYSLFFFLVS